MVFVLLVVIFVVVCGNLSFLDNNKSLDSGLDLKLGSYIFKELIV